MELEPVAQRPRTSSGGRSSSVLAAVTDAEATSSFGTKGMPPWSYDPLVEQVSPHVVSSWSASGISMMGTRSLGSRCQVAGGAEHAMRSLPDNEASDVPRVRLTSRPAIVVEHAIGDGPE